VKETSRYAAAFKPNAAFFEVFGPDGWTALKEVIDAIQEESDRIGSMIPVILDAKRGDIASTAEAYAKSAFGNLGAHCITLNPYLGKDSIEPFIQDSERGVFLLCKTSNAGSMDLQNLLVLPVGSDNPMPLYNYVAQLAQQWNVKNNIGIVVGATHPQIMSNIRASVPDMWFLAPGIGAQGGELEQALKSGLRKDGKGMLINVSRAVARAEKPGIAAGELRDQILMIKRDLNREAR
jgi:orotidine 5'-phosphate decarboxylase subfamily 2